MEIGNFKPCIVILSQTVIVKEYGGVTHLETFVTFYKGFVAVFVSNANAHCKFWSASEWGFIKTPSISA